MELILLRSSALKKKNIETSLRLRNTVLNTVHNFYHLL